MRIAIPMTNGKMSPHFGHCEKFALIDVDEAAKSIRERKEVDAPPHQPGLLPGWLREQGADMIIAGGMGHRARGFFAEMGIEVQVGAPSQDPEELVRSWLNGSLILGDNVCDH
jgi:predicted Fe-Mo cluster-binding NifX family protein